MGDEVGGGLELTCAEGAQAPVTVATITIINRTTRLTVVTPSVYQPG